MSNSNPIWLALAALALAIPATPAAAQDAELVKRFLSEAPPAWEKFDKATEYAQGTFEMTIRNGALLPVEDGAKEMTFLIESTRNKRCSSIVSSLAKARDDRGQSGAAIAFVKNPEYAIELERSSSDEAWHLEHVAKDWSDANYFTPTTPRSWVETGTRIASGKSIIVGQVPSMHARTVYEVVTDPGFSVTDIRVSDDGLWRITYIIDPERSEKFRHYISQGIFMLDPAHHWRLVRSETSGEANRITLAFEYPQDDETSNGLPSGLEWSDYFADMTGKYVKQISFRFKINLSVPKKLPPDADFTATAYGLKEPDLKDIK